MKKTIGIVLMLCAGAYGVFAQNGVIRELTGTVELKPAGASAFVPASAGDEVAQDTVVSTGFKSTAVIAAGSSVITVRPLTRLSLSELQTMSGSENLNMNLRAGSVRVDVKPPAGAKATFTVHSPTATASVRGTSFEFDTRRLQVFEGTVIFAGKNGAAIPVSAGGESYVGYEDSAVDPAEVAAAAFTPPPVYGSDSAGGTLLPPQTSEGFSMEIVY